MKSIQKRKREQGAALLLAIFSLILITAIGLAMLFASDTETSISVNYRDKQSALYGALAGLQEARDRVHPLTGDLGPGLGGANILPKALPTLSNHGVLYIINPAPGETVAPWDPNNKYFDNELCQENWTGLGLSAAGPPCPSSQLPAGSDWYTVYDNSSNNTAWQLKDASGTPIPLTYKWVRITLKADNSTPAPVVSSPSGTQVCWDEINWHEVQLPSGYRTDCTMPGDAVTNIAVNVTGSGYTTVPNVQITGGGGSGAAAVASLGDQLPSGLGSATLTSPGTGYTLPPHINVVPSDGNGSGAVVNATLDQTLPVGSVTMNNTIPACYPTGTTPGVGFNPMSTPAATATATMSGPSCVYSIAVTGRCGDGTSSSVTASGGFSGSVTWGGSHNTSSATNVSNPGNYASGSLPASSDFTVHCSNPGNGNNTPQVTPTYGIQITSVSASGGAYLAGAPPTPTFTGPAVVGGPASATAALSGTGNPGPLASLYIPFGMNGSGYTADPTLQIECPPGGTGVYPPCAGGATGTASIAPSHGVQSILVTNGGSGYSAAIPPTVSVECPPGGTGAYPPCANGVTATASVGMGAQPYGAVYLLTSLAQTPSGARAMAQMEVAVIYDRFKPGLGGALTLIGPNPAFGTPHSMPFQMIGTDCPTCGTAPPTCNTTPIPAKDAVGVYDPTNATDPTAVQTVIDALAKPNNYIGANSSPDVHNANLGNMTAPELNSFVSGITSVLTQPAYPSNPSSINLGTAANPTIALVNGDYTMGPTTGYGILVVTGTLTFAGDYSWNGLILVIGNGASIMSGGGNGQVNGAVFVANTAGGTLNPVNVNWNGGGGNGVQYNHCWADDMLDKIPYSWNLSQSSLQVISLRTLPY